ncbi:MAG: CvpA family protein [Muribaculaceae bacterium]|nr:CvpA family protein [Muribaculaceae bacterium]
MSITDIIILVVLALALVMGFKKGFLKQLGTVAGLVIAILVCRFYGDVVVGMLVDAEAKRFALYRVLVYILLFIVVFICVGLVAGLLANALSALHVRIVDRIAGAVFGVLTWAFFMSIAINVYLMVSPDHKGHFMNHEKPWRPFITQMAPKVLGYVM